MAFLQKNIRIIWWLTAFAASNAAWFFIAKVNFSGIIQRFLQPYMDGIFFAGVGFTIIAALIALWSMTSKSAARQRLLAKIWFVYLSLYAVFAAGVIYFFTAMTVTVS